MKKIVKKTFAEAVREVREINDSRNRANHLFKGRARGTTIPVRKYAIFETEGNHYIIKIYEGAEVRLLARKKIAKAVSRFSATRYKKPHSYFAAKHLKQLI